MIICDKNALYYGPVLWVFELIKQSYGIDLISDPSHRITIGPDAQNSICVNESFYVSLLKQKVYDEAYYFDIAPLIKNENGSPDYLSTIFYLVNGFQEYNLDDEKIDKYGRLDYKHSLQNRFSILENNIVQEYIQKLLFQVDPHLKIPLKKSRIFLSHDIDSVYGSLKYDSIWALKTGDILSMLKVIGQTAMKNPPWFNMDKVAKLESDHDVKACYYWIVQNGRGAHGEKNGDYSIFNQKIQQQMSYVEAKGNEIGLHKSSMNTSFNEEKKKLDTSVLSNRFHFLKIDNPNSFSEMESCGIQSDSSIGFPYKMGFKNSFGLPYFPFDISKNKKFDVLEVPLHIMDGMFEITNEETSEKAYHRITQFIEQNSTNSIISILWHNSEMTNFAYKWSFHCYKRILQYIISNNYDTVLPSQLVKEYQTK